ncbi:hypothetical protein AKUH3B101J_09080 [Apilactobacillus kunkeei]|nr:hypothetical protein AKUH3B104J_09080 [Apilactobacillus kunkeei]CAI2615929.1 hypothetical protein AKUH3B101J_09080 [Apilactobacillus kunkeei]
MSLLTIPKVQCFQCGHSFTVSMHTIETEDVRCPYCNTLMDHETQKDVAHALNCLAEVNGNFKKYNAERDEPLFQVSADIREVKLSIDKN